MQLHHALTQLLLILALLPMTTVSAAEYELRTIATGLDKPWSMDTTFSWPNNAMNCQATGERMSRVVKADWRGCHLMHFRYCISCLTLTQILQPESIDYV